MLKATGQRLVFCAAWSHCGFEANQCCWLLLNAENKQMVFMPCVYSRLDSQHNRHSITSCSSDHTTFHLLSCSALH